MTCRCFAAWTLWELGYPNQALRRINEAATLAQELSHLNSQAFALTCAAWLYQFLREARLTQERAEALLTLAEEQGLQLWTAWGVIFRGWALTKQGQEREGIVQMTQGLTAYRVTGAEFARPHFLALLAEAHGKIGSSEEGLAVLAEAFAAVSKNDDRYYEAELYRIKGALTLAQSKVQGPTSNVEEEAEECFLKAIEVAQKQQAKSLELRATVSLARLWQHQGKQHEAHRMLSEVYNWFTEGFDTKDLQEAKALLDELR